MRSNGLALLVVLTLTGVARADKPPVTFEPAARDHYRSGRSMPIDTVVIHTVEGSLQSCINTFRSGSRKVSAHYIVGKAGAIVQMVNDRDTAWHANGANSRSIGIEHEGFAGRRDTWNDTNMRVSARLTRYLCDTYGIPIDRRHIIGHFEAPGSNHSDPGIYFDWDLYMRLVRGEGGSVDEDGLPLPARPGMTNGNGNGSGSDMANNPGGSNGGSESGNGGANGQNGRGRGGRGGMEGALGGIWGDREKTIDPMLANGSRGEAVRRLQEALVKAGFPIAVDGIFGPETDAAVRGYQASRHCAVDGIVGPETWGAIHREPREARTSAPVDKS